VDWLCRRPVMVQCRRRVPTATGRIAQNYVKAFVAFHVCIFRNKDTKRLTGFAQSKPDYAGAQRNQFRLNRVPSVVRKYCRLAGEIAKTLRYRENVQLSRTW